MHLKQRVIVNVLVQVFRSEHKSSHHFARMKRFLLVGNDSPLDRFHDTVRYHFGVNPEIFFPLEQCKDRVRDASNAQLQRCPVFNEVRDVRRYLPLKISRDPFFERLQRL
jgi:hypothetical protein